MQVPHEPQSLDGASLQQNTQPLCGFTNMLLHVKDSNRDTASSVEPLSNNAESQRMAMWSNHLQDVPHELTFTPKESIPPGAEEAWPTWACLNRLRTGTGRCRTLLKNGASYQSDKLHETVGRSRPWGISLSGPSCPNHAPRRTWKP
ncbi:hypothetical protein Bbelb_393200 [Branchiostoma belcheri]|nr:hypothetical protein Bbelb_393200 [Branchiostoma belcheri]